MGHQKPDLPPSKLRREARRLIHQFVTAPAVLTSYLFAARYYDLVLGKKVRRIPGQIAATKKIAIYLIFPQQGLLGSHLRALEYLQSKDYAPVVARRCPNP